MALKFVEQLRWRRLSVCVMSVYVCTGLWFPSEPAVWPTVWGQRPVQWNSAEEVGTGFQVGCADLTVCNCISVGHFTCEIITWKLVCKSLIYFISCTFIHHFMKLNKCLKLCILRCFCQKYRVVQGEDSAVLTGQNSSVSCSIQNIFIVRPVQWP